MRKVVVAITGSAAILSAEALTWKAEAQTSRGAASLHTTVQNFTPIEKTACGPYRGRWCGPWHHRVCGPYRCWCAPC